MYPLIAFSISDVSNTVGSLVSAVRTAVQTAATGGGGTSQQPPAVSTGSNNELMLTSQTQVGARTLILPSLYPMLNFNRASHVNGDFGLVC